MMEFDASYNQYSYDLDPYVFSYTLPVRPGDTVDAVTICFAVPDVKGQYPLFYDGEGIAAIRLIETQIPGSNVVLFERSRQWQRA